MKPEYNRILFVHANNDEVGGADFCLFKMVYEVQRAGWQPLVLLRRRTDIVLKYEQHGIRVLVRPIVRLQKHAGLGRLMLLPWQMLRTVCTIVRLIRREKVHCLHSNDLLDVAANVAAKIAGVPSLQHIRMIVNSPRWLQRMLSGLALLFSDRILCVSDGVRRYMFPKPSDHVAILYDWLDMKLVGHLQNGRSFRHELGLTADDKLVGCVGRLEEWKGQHLFLQAADLITREDPGVHFVVIGGPTAGKEAYAKRLAGQQASSVNRARIHLLGHRQDVAAIMKELDVLVHSSIQPDPLPGVVMEGMTCGTLVVGAADGGVPEQISDGRNGFLYRAGDVADMVRTIQKALLEPNRKALLQQAGDDARHRFNKQYIMKQLLQAYRTVCEPAGLNTSESFRINHTEVLNDD
jgi:glycosyltransferase involved in cell wall biosynthesis